MHTFNGTIKTILMTVQDILAAFQTGSLQIPKLQRTDKVYSDKKAMQLIASIRNGFCTPITFWQNPSTPKVTTLLDGLQRLTALARFAGLHPTLTRLYDKHHDFSKLTAKQKKEFLATPIPVFTYVTSDEKFARTAFILMNTTQVAMNTAEVRHSKFFDTDFMAVVHSLAEKHKAFFTGHGIIASGKYCRLKGEDLVAQLLACVYLQVANGLDGVQFVANNSEVDAVVEAFVKNPDKDTLNEAAAQFSAIIGGIDQHFPLLYKTRFVTLSSFRALFLVFWHYKQTGYRPQPGAMACMLNASDEMAQDLAYAERTKGGGNNTRTMRQIFSTVQDRLLPAFMPPPSIRVAVFASAR